MKMLLREESELTGWKRVAAICFCFSISLSFVILSSSNIFSYRLRFDCNIHTNQTTTNQQKTKKQKENKFKTKENEWKRKQTSSCVERSWSWISFIFKSLFNVIFSRSKAAIFSWSALTSEDTTQQKKINK